MRDGRLPGFEGSRRRLLVERFGPRPIRIPTHQLNQSLHRSAGGHRTIVQSELDAHDRVALVIRGNALQGLPRATQIVGLEHRVQYVGPELRIIRHDFAAYQAAPEPRRTAPELEPRIAPGPLKKRATSSGTLAPIQECHGRSPLTHKLLGCLHYLTESGFSAIFAEGARVWDRGGAQGRGRQQSGGGKPEENMETFRAPQRSVYTGEIR